MFIHVMYVRNCSYCLKHAGDDCEIISGRTLTLEMTVLIYLQSWLLFLFENCKLSTAILLFLFFIFGTVLKMWRECLMCRSVFWEIIDTEKWAMNEDIFIAGFKKILSNC
jgi:hypothetical protein